MTPQILMVLAGTSGVIGLLSLVSYFYYSYRVAEIQRSERSIKKIVEGEGLFNADQILHILREFKTDESRLEALKTFANLSQKSAAMIYDKIKGDVDIIGVEDARAANIRRASFASATFFTAIAILALVYTYLQSRPGPNPPPSPNAFEIFNHDRVVDLTDWKVVPADQQGAQISKVVWVDKFKIKRHHRDVREFVLRRAVTGTIEPEFNSPSHRITVRPTGERPLAGPRPIDRLYDVLVDVSNEPVNEWFNIQLFSVYWNVFVDQPSQWVAIPIQFPTGAIRFELFSPNRPFKGFQREAYDRSEMPLTKNLVNEPTAERSPDGKRIVWHVGEPRTNWIYKVAWEW